MKLTINIIILLFVIVISLIGVDLAASNDFVYLLEETYRSADELIAAGEKELYEIQRTESHMAAIMAHLVEQAKSVKLRMQVALLEKKIAIDFPHVHVMQEMLLQLQNDILMQSSAIYKAGRDATQLLENITRESLIESAESLCRESKQAKVKYSNTPEKAFLEYEVGELVEFTNMIAPQSINQTKEFKLKKQQQLLLHQRTVRDLEAKADWRLNQPVVNSDERSHPSTTNQDGNNKPWKIVCSNTELFTNCPPNSFCPSESESVCRCNFGYIWSNSKDNCTQLNCTTDTDCLAHFNESECNHQSKCQCRSTFTSKFDEHNQKCVTSSVIYLVCIIVGGIFVVILLASIASVVIIRHRRRIASKTVNEEQEQNSQEEEVESSVASTELSSDSALPQYELPLPPPAYSEIDENAMFSRMNLYGHLLDGESMYQQQSSSTSQQQQPQQFSPNRVLSDKLTLI